MKLTRTQIINGFINKYDYKSYLEIGVNTPAQPGYNFDYVKVDVKHGVDPAVDTTFKVTSDEFFEKHVKMKYDLIFVDGLHIFEQAYRDIVNSLKWLNENGTIVVHDCNPVKEITQRRERASDVWHGDVWKAILKLRIDNPDVMIYTINADEGCVIIRKGRQELLKPKPNTDIYSFEFLNANRKEVLNLISIKEFQKKMSAAIIMKLDGGLGNQMFQYALGRNLSLRHSVDLKLDASQLGGPGKTCREYALNVFQIKECMASPEEVKALSGNSWFDRVSAVVGKIFILKSGVFIEKKFAFDPVILSVTNGYLAGYWQSEKYFNEISPVLKNGFKLKEAISNPKWENEITGESVAIHVRRSDYVSDEKTKNYHGVLPLEYYQAAIKLVKEKISSPKFYVFSDDIKWCEENLKDLSLVKFVSGNKSHEDLFLISKCKHQIIANSSFSWWGAWLNENPGKMVVAPKKWFSDPSINTADLIPEKWIRI